MNSKEKQIDILSPKGDVLVRFKIRETDLVPGNPPVNETHNATLPKETKTPLIQNGEHMTEAQKKYLFRLCAAKGLSGEDAHIRLKELFGVDALKDVTKLEASHMIEQLLEESKGGNGNEPSF